MSDSLEPAAYTVASFCAAHAMSRTGLYKAWAQSRGPRFFQDCPGGKIRSTAEAAAEFRRKREAETAANFKPNP